MIRAPDMPERPDPAQCERLKVVVPGTDPLKLWEHMRAVYEGHPQVNGFYAGLDGPATDDRVAYILAAQVLDIETRAGRPLLWTQTPTPSPKPEVLACLTRRLLVLHPLFALADVTALAPGEPAPILTSVSFGPTRETADTVAAMHPQLDVEAEFMDMGGQMLRLALLRFVLNTVMEQGSWRIPAEPKETLLGVLARCVEYMRPRKPHEANLPAANPRFWVVIGSEEAADLGIPFLDLDHAGAFHGALDIALADRTRLQVNVHVEPYFPARQMLVGWADGEHDWSPVKVRLGPIDFEGEHLIRDGGPKPRLRLHGRIELPVKDDPDGPLPFAHVILPQPA